MTPNDIQRKRFIMIGAIAVFVIISITFVLTRHKTSNTDTGRDGKTTVYHDPVSGQDIITQDDKNPELTVDQPTMPLFAGFGKLANVGMTQSQIAATYKALQAYKPFASNDVQISLAVDDVKTVQPQNSDPLYRWSIKSRIVVDRTDTYTIQIYYWEVTNVQVYLSNTKGTQVYDSGAVSSLPNSSEDNDIGVTD